MNATEGRWSLFNSAYSAIGFWSAVDQLGGDLFRRIPAILESSAGGGDIDTYEDVMGWVSPEAQTAIASTAAMRDWGPEWRLQALGVGGVGRQPAPRPMAIGEREEWAAGIGTQGNRSRSAQLDDSGTVTVTFGQDWSFEQLIDNAELSRTVDGKAAWGLVTGHTSGQWSIQDDGTYLLQITAVETRTQVIVGDVATDPVVNSVDPSNLGRRDHVRTDVHRRQAQPRRQHLHPRAPELDGPPDELTPGTSRRCPTRSCVSDIGRSTPARSADRDHSPMSSAATRKSRQSTTPRSAADASEARSPPLTASTSSTTCSGGVDSP